MGELQSVWMPFLLAILIVGIAIWKIVQWQHKVRLDNLASQLELYREISSFSATSSVSSAAPALPPSPAESEPLPPLIDTRATEEGERIFVEEGVTTSTLRALVAEASSMLASQRAVEPYVGKWFKISGEVTNLALVGVGEPVVLAVVKDSDQEVFAPPTLNLFFSDNFPGDAAEMIMQPIRAVGRFNSATPVSLNFWDCELEG